MGESMIELAPTIMTCEGCGGQFTWRRTGHRFCSGACGGSHTFEKPRPDTSCAKCGRLFHPPNNRQRYCSHACAPGRPRTTPDQICAHCARAFRPTYGGKRKYLYCGHGCHFAALAAMRNRICPQCGKAFTYRGKPRKFCSRECFSMAAGHRSPDHTCETCGTTFRRGSHHRGHVARFCSRACSSVAQRRPKLVLCLRCQGPVPKPAKLRGTNESGALCRFPKYCSDECRYGPGRRRAALAALLCVLRRRLAAERHRLLDSRQFTERYGAGAFCVIVCLNCGGRMPRHRAFADRRRWCSKRCAHQMRKRYSLWKALSGQAEYELLLTVGLLKKANRLVEDSMKGTSHVRNSEDANVPGSS